MSVINKENHNLLIEEFFLSDEKTLIVNQVNDEIGIFYIGLMKYYADKHGIKINIINDNDYIESDIDLFGLSIIKIYNFTNTKKLTSTLNAKNKKIIFTDYKNYKRLNLEYNCINGYKFEIDIIFFIRNELKIKNDELVNFCKNNPVLSFSEISKFLINKNQYSSDQALINEKNNILDLRKSIFENKKNNFNVKNLYLNIKKEAEYKKFSFLTY